MKIQSVQLENIKRFGPKGAIFNFSRYHEIYTISGRNGSGKTAIFKAIQLFQKLFFFNQLEPEEFGGYEVLERNLKDEVESLLSASQGLIDVVFVDQENKYQIKLIIESGQDTLAYEFSEGPEGSIVALENYWNPWNPQRIVAFLDAGKSFSDFGVSFNNINLQSRKQKHQDFILDCIFEPDKTLQAIYRKTVLDHVQYRLDPSRTYDYFRSANIAIKQIAPNIDVKNVSATKVDGQLVILGRTSEKVPLFDVKDFSAGERALYLTLLFIFYLPNVGILIVDEPENHLHESLLRGFYNFLKEVISAKSASAWLDRKSSKKDATPGLVASENNGALSQVFLTTHSKALIYQNLGHGECLVISEDGASPLEESSIERELRTAGISMVFSRTLFVEGSTDISLLRGLLEKHGIKVMAAENCKEVVDYFKKISKIRANMHDAAFCFAIDSDNRSKDDIAEIKSIDEGFFEQSFVVLDRHELENYLIDKKLIADALNPALSALSKEQITDKKMSKIFKEEAEALKEQSRAKFLSSALKLKLKSEVIDPIVNTKTLSKRPVADIISDKLNSDTASKIAKTAEELVSEFDIAWTDGWMKLVDGKAFMGKIISRLSKECAGIESSIIRENIILQLQRNPSNYAAGELIEKINEKMNLQCAF